MNSLARSLLALLVSLAPLTSAFGQAVRLAPFPADAFGQAVPLSRFPADAAANISPDTTIRLTFADKPAVGEKGLIRIYDATDNSLVDTLDLAIPPSPHPTGSVPNPTGATKAPPPPPAAAADTKDFQVNNVGGNWFYFFPVIIRDNTAVIQPHTGALKYGHRYTVKLDAGVLNSPAGALAPTEWSFSTRAAGPDRGASRLTVAADGSGDFNSVQGAIDFLPAAPAQKTTIFIKNGHYDEIVYAKGKSNVIVRGEDRDQTIVGYPNNSAFNRVRPAFSLTDVNDVQLSTFTINNYFSGQAEALLARGEHIILDRMTLNGSGDAFTTYGTLYMVDSKLFGNGDTILGYAALFGLRCTIESTGPFSWTRTPKGSHGNVFVDSTFVYVDKPLPWSITKDNPEGRKAPGSLARLPQNGAGSTNGSNFPYAEMVLINCKTDGVIPEGWGPIQEQPAFDWSNVHFWEFNTVDLKTGKPADISQRHKIVRELDKVKDADLIKDYSTPQFVLNGWTPVVQ